MEGGARDLLRSACAEYTTTLHSKETNDRVCKTAYALQVAEPLARSKVIYRIIVLPDHFCSVFLNNMCCEN